MVERIITIIISRSRSYRACRKSQFNYLVSNVVREPIKTFIKPLSRSCTGALDVPESSQGTNIGKPRRRKTKAQA